MQMHKILMLISLCMALSHLGCQVPKTAPKATQASEIDQLVKELKGEAPAKERYGWELESAYKKVLDALLPKIGSENPEEQKAPQQDLQAICWYASRPGAEAERAAVCKAIASRLKPELPNPAKTWLLLQLERVGRAESVDSVAKLLNDRDPIIRDCARRAMQGNPSPRAAKALRKAVDRATTSEWRATLLNALAYRADKSNARTFLKYATDTDDAVRSAAIRGLAALGEKSAVQVIETALNKGDKRAQALAADAYLLLADILCAQGDKSTALAMYQRFLTAESHLKCAAITGLARAGGIAELPTILAALEEKDSKVQGAAMCALQEMPGSQVTLALVKKTRAAAPEIKIKLLCVLARRGDKALLPILIEAANDPNESVRIAAYEGMGLLADEKAASTLVNALVKTKDAEQSAAIAALGCISGEGVVEAIIQGLAQADPTGRVLLVKTLAARRSEKVLPALFKAAEDAEVSVRVEALKALSSLAQEKDLPTLLGLLGRVKENKNRAELEKTIAATCLRVEREDRGVEPLLTAYKTTTDVALKCSILRALGMVGGQKSLELVTAALKDTTAEIQDTAVRALADWPDAAPAATLLDIARNWQNQTHRVLALRGYVRVIGLPTSRSPEETLKMLEHGMDAAQRPEEKKLVIAGIAGVPDPAALKLLKPFLNDTALQAEAVLATIKIAEGISLSHRGEAEATLKDLAEQFKDPAIQKQIKDAFQRIAQYDDYITAWQLSGPYTEVRKNEKQLFDIEFPPEKPDTQGVKWQPVSGGTDRSRAWKLDIDKVLYGHTRVAYLRAWLRSDKEQKARLEMGSDDGLKAWLNGQVIVSQNVNRGIAPGQEKVEVTLKKGWNTLLLKITQGGGYWCACVRVRAPDGAPLPGVLLMGDPKALDAAAADLGDETLKAQVSEFFEGMARATFIAYPTETVAALKKAVTTTKNESLRKKLTNMLSECARYEDLITTWQMAGPYTDKDAGSATLFDAVLPPEKPEHGGAKWTPIAMVSGSTKPGIIELDKAIGGNNCVAYLRTYIWSPKKQEALLELGSDDGVKAWLNGSVVVASNVVRGNTPGQDKTKVTLEQGWNTLMLKVTQVTGEWTACARFRDVNGAHLDGLKIQAQTPSGVKFVPSPEKTSEKVPDRAR